MKKRDKNLPKDWNRGKSKFKEVWLFQMESIRIEKKSKESEIKLMTISWAKNLMLDGKMLLDLKTPRAPWKRQFYYLFAFQKCLLDLENLGKEYYSMVHLGLERLTWQRLAQERQIQLFFQYNLQQYLANT